MKVEVKLFAKARDLAGSDRVILDVPTGASVSDLRFSLGREYPSLAPLLPTLLIALGTNYATDATLIPPDVEIACFPPVSGG